MKRLKAPPPGVAGERGTQVTALNVLPARRLASVGDPPPAPAPVLATTNAADSAVVIWTTQVVMSAGFDDVSILVILMRLEGDLGMSGLRLFQFRGTEISFFLRRTRSLPLFGECYP
jgi:hypothetical protein